MRRNLFVWVLFCILGAKFGVKAQGVAINGLNYQLNTTTYEAVLYSGESWRGELSIPAEVSYGGRKYAVTSIADAAFAGSRALTAVIIPESVTTIGQSSFSDCSNLTSVVIQEGTINIEASAFRNCSRLSDISIPVSVSRIGARTFEGTAWYDNQPDGLVYAGNVVYKYKGTISRFNYLFIKDGTRAIACDAFRNCVGMADIYIPEGVTEIGDYAFCGCSDLTDAWFPQSLTKIGEYAFYGCKCLRSVTIRKNVTKIGIHAFEDCSGLGAVTIEEGIKEISPFAFANCSYLSSVSLPDGMSHICDHAFSGCTSLTMIVIPNSVTRIGGGAFSACDNLKNVYSFATNVPETDADAFEEASTSSMKLHVPEGTVNMYRKTVPWSRFGSIIAQIPLNITINETTFPDEVFRNYLLSRPYGLDGVLTNEELANITHLYLYGKDIKSLRGIEYFYALTDLNCTETQLYSLDLSKNTELAELQISSENLNVIDVSKNIHLRGLYCDETPLTSLDLSNNTELMYLGCDYCQLTSLDLTNNTELTELWCVGNRLSELDLSKNNALTRLECYDNKLERINLSGCSALTTIDCYANQLSTLDVTDCKSLTWFRFDQNRIREAGMDALVKSLPATEEGTLYALYSWNEQNVMNTIQVEVAKSKGWRPQLYKIGWYDYYGSEPANDVSYIQGQMATIILPVVPDASKGRYYRLDRCENGQIIFEGEPNPKAHVPYIIVPYEDFNIDLTKMDLNGLHCDTVSTEGVSFIGSFNCETFGCKERCYIDIVDTTPDCLVCGANLKMAIIGSLRACLIVKWDDPYSQGGTRGIKDKLEIILHDDETGIAEMKNDRAKSERFNDGIYDLQGRRLLSKPTKGLYMQNGKKIIVK